MAEPLPITVDEATTDAALARLADIRVDDHDLLLLEVMMQ